MEWDYLTLNYQQLAWAALLILINAAVSLALRLRLEREITLAAIRTMVQLLLIGLVLTRVFALRNPWITVGLMLCMSLIAGWSAVSRTHRRFRGIWLSGLTAVAISSWLTTAIALALIIKVRPWHQPQYAIPLLGMVLGNSLNGISLGLDRFGEELATRRGEVETMLALGANRWEAAHETVVAAVRTGMMPILNAMMVVGIVSLPGMMTGQLLAGVEPIQAVKYQVVIMFVIAAATALGTVLAVLIAFRYRFNRRHQFQ